MIGLIPLFQLISFRLDCPLVASFPVQRVFIGKLFAFSVS